jgi:hypothetical protein
MASSNDDAKVDQEVLDILEKESKEFDKVRAAMNLKQTLC